nr:unnamed protein product [Digitaria exilis]
MEVIQTAAQPPSCSSPAIAYPRWVLLEPYAKIVNVYDSSCGSCLGTADPKTLAATTTSTGHRIHISPSSASQSPRQWRN